VAKIEDGQGFGTIVDNDWSRYVTASGSVLGTSLGDGSFSLWVFETKWGKVNYREGTVIRFSSSTISVASFDSTLKKVHLEGNGWNNGHSVTYQLDVVDNGTGALDLFSLTLSDGSHAVGTLKSGNVAYSG